MRTQYFFNHPWLDDLQYPAFAVIQDRVYIVGGIDLAKGTDEEGSIKIKQGHGTLIIEVPIYQK